MSPRQTNPHRCCVLRAVPESIQYFWCDEEFPALMAVMYSCVAVDDFSQVDRGVSSVGYVMLCYAMLCYVMLWNELVLGAVMSQSNCKDT